jgi:hypothetical protein
MGRCSRQSINSILKANAQSSLVQLSYSLWNGAKSSGVWRKYILGNGENGCMDVYFWKICWILGICEDLAAIFYYCANYSVFVGIFVDFNAKLSEKYCKLLNKLNFLANNEILFIFN